MTWKYAYYLRDGRGPFESVQAAMDELGLDKATRPKHNRWSRLSAPLRDSIQRQVVAVKKAKFQPGDKVRFGSRATRYITVDLRKRTRTIVDVFYDPVKKCCFYELGARGNGTLGYFFRSFMLQHANGTQHTIGRPRGRRRYNRHRKVLFKPPNQNLRAYHREAYHSLRQRKGRVLQALAALEGENPDEDIEQRKERVILALNILTYGGSDTQPKRDDHGDALNVAQLG